MSNAVRPVLLAGVLAAAGVTMAPSFAPAADLAVAAPMHHAARWCGPCGCLHVGYVRHRELRTTYGIAHDFEIYQGTHTSHVAVRFQEHVMPFFSRTLSFERPAR